jgi:hypothetical protein
MKLLMLGGYVMRVCLIFVGIALASCAPQTQYIRADGRYASPQSIEGALAECGSESKDNLCMVEKGYFNVAAEQAEAKRTQLAAIAVANEQARLAKAKEEKERAKAKKKEGQAKLAAQSAEQSRKQALDARKRKRTVNSSTSDASIWSNPPMFNSMAPARR